MRIVLSSANKDAAVYLRIPGKSLMKMENRIGPKKVP
jgi:hypothetical protein